MSTTPGQSLIEVEMLNAIREYFEERASPDRDSKAPASAATVERRLQLATAVLFLQVMAADREETAPEHAAVPIAISKALGVDARDAAIILGVGRQYVKTPLPELLRVLKERSSREQRMKVVEGMWRLAFADADLAGHEEYFVRKVATALSLSTADLVETKVNAQS